MATTWDEIKRLAADFQRAQLTDNVQRLSDRNCIEIVQKLIELKMIDVLYTCDGKEYLTPKELEKQILEEVDANGGRVNIVEIQQSINVDLTHIESKINDILKDNSLQLILGQLMNDTYLESLADEINDKLKEKGQVFLPEISKSYNLPGDFLRKSVLTKFMGNRILGEFRKNDQDNIFTENFLKREKFKLRGALNGLTKPVQLSSIIKCGDIIPNLAIPLTEQLIQEKEIKGTLNGSKIDSAFFVPDIYSSKQMEYVSSFFKQNAYLEFDSLHRLGISNAKDYIKKKIADKNITYLNTCAIGGAVIEQLDATIEDAMSSNTILDVRLHLPSIMDIYDIGQILQKACKNKSNAKVFGYYVVPNSSVNYLADEFKEDMKKKAIEFCNNMKQAPQPVVEEKSAKGKKGKNRRKEESDQGSSEPTEFLPVQQILQRIGACDKLKDLEEDLTSDIAEYLYRPLTKRFCDIIRETWDERVSGSSNDRKTEHEQIQKLLIKLWTTANIYGKGIDLFEPDQQDTLIKHFLRTTASELVDYLFKLVASEYMLTPPSERKEDRTKFLQKISDEKERNLFKELNSSLSGKSIKEFFAKFPSACLSFNIQLKKSKQAEKDLVTELRHAFIEKLNHENDPACCLHLAVTLLINTFTRTVVHAPGKFVPSMIKFLKDKKYLTEDNHKILQDCNDWIIQVFKSEISENSTLQDQIAELLPKVKQLALTSKKMTAGNTENAD